MKRKWKIILPTLVVGILGFFYYEYKETKQDFGNTQYIVCKGKDGLYQELMKNYGLIYREGTMLEQSGYCSLLADCIEDNLYNKYLLDDIFGIDLFKEGEREQIIYSCDKEAIEWLQRKTQQQLAEEGHNSTGGNIFNDDFTHLDGYFKCSNEIEQQYPWLPDYKIDEFCGCSGKIYTKYDRIYRNKVTNENREQIMDEINADIIKICDYEAFVKWAEEHKF